MKNPRSLVLSALVLAGLPLGLASAQPADTAAPARPAAGKSLAELMASEPDPEVSIGAKAPALQIAEWIRGDPVKGFEPGRTYVVEFWATWCGPCIMAFPHLAELQKEHADDLTVIGVNIWEQSEGEERAEMVREFVAEHDEMAYTVALEQGAAMAETWMQAAQLNGIPAAFVVDAEGRIAWMGHPMAMDEPLAEIIKGEYDVDAARERQRAERLSGENLPMNAFAAFRRAVEAKSWDRAADLAAAMGDEAFTDVPQGLNALAWFLSDDADAPARCHELALKLATKACEITEWSDWSVLDTYAQAAFRTGDREGAVRWQTKAVELAPEEAAPVLKERLEAYAPKG